MDVISTNGAASTANGEPGRVLVLIAEDRDGPRYVKHSILQRSGFAVLETASGQAVLSLVRQHAPAVVLLSTRLPDINGLEVCRLLKSDPQTARTLVLMTSSGFSSPRLRAQALDGGADAYLVEPVEPEELASNINALLRLRGVEDAWHRTSRALHENEDLFRQLAECVGNVVWIIEPSQPRLVFVSSAFETLWGRPASELGDDPRRCLAWLPEAERPRVSEAFERMLRDGHLDTEFQLVRPDGDVREVSVRAFPVNDAEGRFVRVAGICQDITRHKRAERMLRDEEHRRDDFLAMLAHELRNPLAPMRSAIDLLMQQTPSREDMFRARDVIARQLHHLTRLVDELLDISRFNQGVITLRDDLVELRSALNTAVETVRPQLEARHHALRLSLPEQPLPVRGDLVRLTQIFANLLQNAAQYTPDAGSITVEASVEDRNVSVRIRDDGRGLTPAMQRHLFDPLAPEPAGPAVRPEDEARGVPADPGGAQETAERPAVQTAGQPVRQPDLRPGAQPAVREGSGIGLTLVRKLVALHGGRIRAHSAGQDQGSTFTVDLPVQPWQSWRPGAAPRTVPPTTPRTILLVDDNADALEAMTMTLQALGHTVVTATDGSTAIERAASLRPDVVLLDLGMPAMDGFETARRLRAMPELDTARLVALTGFGLPDDRRRTHDAGFDMHLVKPADLAALSAMLAQLDG